MDTRKSRVEFKEILSFILLKTVRFFVKDETDAMCKYGSRNAIPTSDQASTDYTD